MKLSERLRNVIGELEILPIPSGALRDQKILVGKYEMIINDLLIVYQNLKNTEDNSEDEKEKE